MSGDGQDGPTPDPQSVDPEWLDGLSRIKAREHDPVTAAGQDEERLVTPEMITSARWAADAHHVLDETIARIIVAVAPDIAADVRRECAEELREALVPTDRGFIRADDPETTRWMQGWDEATAAARALANRWSGFGRAPADAVTPHPRPDSAPLTPYPDT